MLHAMLVMFAADARTEDAALQDEAAASISLVGTAEASCTMALVT
jgi:hypothetical protein